MADAPRPEAPAWQQALAGALAEALPRLLEEQPQPLLQELIGALTAALCRGEVGLDLAGEAPEGVSAALWPEAHRQALLDSALVQDPCGPLQLLGSCLGWRRWQQRRAAVLQILITRAETLTPSPVVGPGVVDPHASSSDRGDGLAGLDGAQQQAVRIALERNLVLILGGPGTGKTRTVARLLQELQLRQPGLRLHLAAPTGKATARLRAASGGLVPCSTLHRLLESRGESFGRNRHHPLTLDLLVVDEVSMVDLELIEALLEALPAPCRLVLVGDPAQLPPIAPAPLLPLLLEPEAAAALAAVTVELRTTYRNAGAIARVAAALRQGLDSSMTTGRRSDPLPALRPLLQALGPRDNLHWRQASSARLPAMLVRRLLEHRRRLAQLAADCWPGRDEGWQELLAERERLLVLAPLRRGRWGIDAIHRTLLALPVEGGRAGSSPAPLPGSPIPWPHGTPLLCRRNLPELGLANGDIGILVRRSNSPASGNSRASSDSRILFGQDAPLWLHPAQLAGALEPALALTVHKAQGSEADGVIVLLDGRSTTDPRLLYTALTRARRQALLITASDPPSDCPAGGAPPPEAPEAAA
ncbi:MAG: ATP-dependent RecD-like DNA helicase [Cyanobium sp.]